MKTVPQLPSTGQVASEALTIDGFHVEMTDEPRIRDADLGTRLGFARPRVVRELIGRWGAELGDLDVRRAVRRTFMPRGGERIEAVEETWLTEEQALFITAKSETPTAVAMLKTIIRVFTLARRGLLGARDIKPGAAPPGDPVDAFLAAQLRAACASPRAGCACVRCAGITPSALLAGLGVPRTHGAACVAAGHLRRRGWTRGDQRRQGGQRVRPWFPPGAAPLLPPLPPAPASLPARLYPNLVTALGWAAGGEAVEEVAWRMAFAGGVDLTAEVWALMAADLTRKMAGRPALAA